MPSLVEIGPVLLEKKIFSFRQLILLFFKIISPWKRVWPFIWEIWIPTTQWCFVPRLVEIARVVLEKKIFKFSQCNFAISWFSPLGKECGPSFEHTWIPTDGRRTIRKAHFGFQLRWAKKTFLVFKEISFPFICPIHGTVIQKFIQTIYWCPKNNFL